MKLGGDDRGAYIGIYFLDQAGHYLGQSSYYRGLKGDNDWTRLSAIGDIPPRARSIGIFLSLSSYGEAWFDSLSLDQIVLSNEPPHIARLVVTDNVIRDHFLGLGAQYDPFLYGPRNSPPVTEDDLRLVESRIAQIHPRLVRIVVDMRWWVNLTSDVDKTTGRVRHSVVQGRRFDTPMMKALLRELAFFQRLADDIQINLVVSRPNDWEAVDFPILVPQVSDLLKFLVRDQGFTQVRYITLYNEPNYEFQPNQDMDVRIRNYVQLNSLMRLELQSMGFPAELVGVDDAHSLTFFSAMVRDLAPLVGLLSYHSYPDYTSFPGYNTGLSFALEAQDRIGVTQIAATDKPVVIWEFNVRGRGSDSNSSGKTELGAIVIDQYDSAFVLAQLAISAMNVGISGLSYWQAVSEIYGGEVVNDWGLWTYKDKGWRIRPAYYLYGLLTRLTQAGATVAKVASVGCEQSLVTTWVKNPDGTRTLYVVNPWDNEVNLQVAGIGVLWQAKRYLITEATVKDLTSSNALFATSTAVGVIQGELQDRLPARSMVAYSDAP